jgi:hypothetical protein
MKGKSGKQAIAIITTSLIVIMILSLTVFTVAWFSGIIRAGFYYEVDASGFFVLYFDDGAVTEEPLIPAEVVPLAVIQGLVNGDTYINDPAALFVERSENPSSYIVKKPTAPTYYPILHMTDKATDDVTGQPKIRTVRIDFSARSKQRVTENDFFLNFDRDIYCEIKVFIYLNGKQPDQQYGVPGSGTVVKRPPYENAPSEEWIEVEENKRPSGEDADITIDSGNGDGKGLVLSGNNRASFTVEMYGDCTAYIEMYSYLRQVDELCEPSIREYGIMLSVGAVLISEH